VLLIGRFTAALLSLVVVVVVPSGWGPAYSGPIG